MWLGKLGSISVTEHAIDIILGARTFKFPPYRPDPKTRELEKFEVEKQLKTGVTETAYSEWSTPVLFAPKKYGKLLFCIYYRKINQASVKDSYHLPRMDECIDSLGDANVFKTLDAYSGYWQVPIKPADKPKTIFVFHAGTSQ